MLPLKHLRAEAIQGMFYRMTIDQNQQCSKPLRLSQVVRQMGFTGSPLPKEEWLKLRETILSLPVEDIPTRLNLPPVIVSCSRCGMDFAIPAFEMNKHIKRGLKEFYCSTLCTMRHFNEKRGFLPTPCKVCGKPVPHGCHVCGEECREIARQSGKKER